MTMLNSLSHDIFDCNSAEFASCERERAHIITAGRMLMREYEGKARNKMLAAQSKPGDYTCELSEVGPNSYEFVNRKTREKMMLFAAKKAQEVMGGNAPATYAEFMANSREYAKDPVFLRVLSGITKEVVRPVLAVTMSNALDWICDSYSVPMGQTRELDVLSNDIFLFEDDSWGASRSKPSNTLYDDVVTLNPALKTAKATIKWYQLVGNDVDLGRYFAAISKGMYSKVMGMVMNQFTAAIKNTKYVPTALNFTNETKNWVTAASKLAMVNGSKFGDTVAIGHPSALAKVLPNGNAASASATNLDAALSMMIGAEHTRYGYLGEYAGTKLYPLDDAIVPGTQNTTIKGVLPTDKILMMSQYRHRPFAMCFEEGTPITVELSPSQTADMTIDVSVSFALDVKPVFASKVAVISTAE